MLPCSTVILIFDGITSRVRYRRGKGGGRVICGLRTNIIGSTACLSLRHVAVGVIGVGGNNALGRGGGQEVVVTVIGVACGVAIWVCRFLNVVIGVIFKAGLLPYK